MNAARRHTPLFGMAALIACGLTAAHPASAQYSAPTVVMSGLANPHGLVFGPDGGLYVAEAGAGGTGPSVVGGDGRTDSYGLTGGISRLLKGMQTRVVAGIPSLAPANDGSSAYGLFDLAFDHSGHLYGVMGLSTDPADRASLTAGGASGDAFGQLVKFNLTDGSRQNVADLGAFEADNNPDGDDVRTDPYSLLHLADGTFVVADASGNDIVKADPATGKVRLLTVFPEQSGYESVPDAIVIGPDKNYYVGELTGVPFPEGAANIYKVNPTTGAATVVASGFTNIADLAFSPDGTLNVLEISEHGLANANGPVPGALFSVNLTSGSKTLIADKGLVFPTGLTVGPGGALYVSNFGVSPTDGQVLRFAPALAVTSLAPASRTAGRDGFTLTVYGTNFTAQSVIEWNGAAQTTAFVNGAALTAHIPASLIAYAGTAEITVSTAAVTSNARPLTIHPRPDIASLSPASKTAGDAAFTLTVNGTGFLPDSLVKWNGDALATTYVSATKLTAFVSASLLTHSGTESVTVTTPDVATSAALSFTVTP